MAELPAADPTVDEELADRVVAAGHRRRRRQWTVAALTLALGGAVALCGLITQIERPGRVGGMRIVPAVDPAGGSNRPAPDPAGSGASPVARIYAAALTHDGGPNPSVLVGSHVCGTVASAPAHCDSGPIPGTVQRQLNALVGGHVRFVPIARGPEGNDEPTVVVFGDLVVTGSRATLGMETLCGPLCGEGRTLVLAERHGEWRVTGTTGPSWIS